MNWITLERLNREVERKDASTAAHTARVALYAQAFAEEIGLPTHEVDRIMSGAIVHDLGKVDIPDGILTKPGRLTADEFEVMKTHTLRGHDRLRDMGETDELVLALVRSHHERIDGTGYPDGLRGENVPPVARMFAVIDTFDALTSIRPYRATIGESAATEALAELSRHAGTWYSPRVVEVFTDLYDSGRLSWILHHLNDDAARDRLPEGPGAVRLDSIASLRDAIRGE